MNCGLIEDEIRFPAVGHQFGAWGEYESSEESRKMVKERVCTVCNVTEYQSYVIGNVIYIDDLLNMIFERIFEVIRRFFE